jgi:hypothetical protein
MTILEAPARPAVAAGTAGTPDAARHPQQHVHAPAAAGDVDPWLTATICPAGSFGRGDTGRLRALLDALSACASIVVLDLRSARLRSRRAADVVEEAAGALELRGGCLLCVHADAESRAHLAEAGERVVILDEDPTA